MDRLLKVKLPDHADRHKASPSNIDVPRLAQVVSICRDKRPFDDAGWFPVLRWEKSGPNRRGRRVLSRTRVEDAMSPMIAVVDGRRRG